MKQNGPKIGSTYRTVGSSVSVDKSVENSVLASIMSSGGNVFTPAMDELSCPSDDRTGDCELDDILDEQESELAAIAKEMQSCGMTNTE